MFNSYRKRVQVDGTTPKDSVISSTKRQMVNTLLDSPSLSEVFIDMQETLPIPCIVSDIRTFFERRFLFLSDMKVNVGDYITHRNYTYLATNKVDNEIYPQLFGELCNTDYPLQTVERKIRVGTDNIGKPIYKVEKVVTYKPCVMSDKIYSQADNSPIPLPEGNLIIKIPYSENESETPKINTVVELDQKEYSVTSVSTEYVVNNVGYLELQLQRIPTT